MNTGGRVGLSEVGTVRLRLGVRGVVQGVGFRPHVHRLAVGLGLSGWVRNEVGGVLVEVEGLEGRVGSFMDRVVAEAPPHSRIRRLEPVWLEPEGGVGFEIRESPGGAGGGAGVAWVVPDLATCEDCLREVLDPGDRRYRYPFTNCTRCGPRYSIVLDLPYDRERTSMRGFRMCARCQAEYDDPGNRRFHAQPNACPDCGPRLGYLGAAGERVGEGEAALAAAVGLVRAGGILAVKGVGGFHLWVGAGDGDAVGRLRERKRRGNKPFAVMVPSVAWARGVCRVTDVEAGLLGSAAGPIVLVRRNVGGGGVDGGLVVDAVAPGNGWLGVMLPYTPLHHLLMLALGTAVVATSGNLGDEPICIEDGEAVGRLRGIADGFLVHDRPIVRPVDDSVVRVMDGRPVVLRRSRGYAPLAIGLEGVLGVGTGGGGVGGRVMVTAVGGHQKNTVAVAAADGREAILGAHVGDLETAGAVEAHGRAIADLERLFRVRPARVVVDGHRDYASARLGRERGLGVEVVQHHHAHVLACLAENGEAPPVFGVVWDGTGVGTDGTVWGGEFLRVTAAGYERWGRLRPFRLPGGEAAVREPRRAAIGVMWEVMGAGMFRGGGAGGLLRGFGAGALGLMEAMVSRGVGSPWTSSAGRLFDAVSAMLGLREVNGFEGEAAMALEHAAEGMGDGVVSEGKEGGVGCGSWGERGGVWEWDWRPVVRGLMEAKAGGAGVGELAAAFHAAAVGAVVEAVRLAGEGRVVLSGGCFQNRLLTEGVLRGLRAAGVRVIWHRWVPPNDGGIALGQVVAAMQRAV